MLCQKYSLYVIITNLLLLHFLQKVVYQLIANNAIAKILISTC